MRGKKGGCCTHTEFLNVGVGKGGIPSADLTLASSGPTANRKTPCLASVGCD